MESSHLKNGALLQGGKYRIVRFIGSGGFGCTYEAEHTLFKSRVAIKEFFISDFCNRDDNSGEVSVVTETKSALVDKLRGKFVNEASVIFNMHHHNIVRVIDVFAENGTAYYVMDYIDGQSLHSMMKTQSRLPEQTAVRYIRQVADALAYVHSQNRLHLDVKPGNIMIDSSDNAILIDFGTSKQYDEEKGENTSTLVGRTPGYAPPEQMGNDVVKFTPSTDVYALGATLYKLLTGITPPSATLLISGEEIEPLPQGTSNGIIQAVTKSLELNRKRRPQNIAEFLGLLDGDSGSSAGTDDSTVINNTSEITVLGYERPTTDHTNTKTQGYINGHEYVDLGLSVKWATCNIGASSPSDYGDYFAWGETTVKYGETEEIDFYGDIGGVSLYDAARAKWGKTWRMPTENELDELIEKCNWKWAKENDCYGYRITGTNGSSIFLPAAGYRPDEDTYSQGSNGHYWSSTPDGSNTNYAFYIHFGSEDFFTDWGIRDSGRSIRPVSE